MSPLEATSARLADLGIRRATVLVDPTRARANIARFAARAAASGVTLRPHFKTHQSAAVASWFAEAGVRCATVSNLDQAEYFLEHGWSDLTLAIGVNPREVDRVADLSRRSALGLVLDHPRQLVALVAAGARAAIWVEVDVGDGRGGASWRDAAAAADLAREGQAADGLEFRGLLTHAGHTYGADPERARRLFATTRDRLTTVATAVRAAGLPDCRISAGDTPGFAAAPDWTGLDEARPGNFVFFDLMQLAGGACSERDLACAVAAPVIGVYPARRQVVVHAGAVHLSKERLETPDGAGHGCLLTLDHDGSFGALAADGVVTALSQEHATVTFATRGAAAAWQPGDLVLIAPVHSCLVCEQFGELRTTGGEPLAKSSPGHR